MNNSIYKYGRKYLLICTLCISALSILALPATSSAQIPFGGVITTYFPACVAPTGAAMIIQQPLPTGGFVPIPLMYLPGASVSFADGPPTHPGQWLLGMGAAFAPCLIPCPLGLCFYPGQPGGMVILFHGSSV